MAAVAQVAYDLWDVAANGMANVGAVAGAAGAAAALHGGKFRGLRVPTSPLGLFMLGGLAAVSILIMVLSTPPVGVGGQRYYSTTHLSVHFKAESTVVAFPIPDEIAQDGGFGDMAMQGMTRKNPITMPSTISAADLKSLAKVMKHIHKSNAAAVGLADWDSVLKLTGVDTPFDFDNLGENLRQLAILCVNALAEQGRVSAAELFDLGRRHSVALWVACSCERLARRDEHLADEEIDRIGSRAASLVMKIQNESNEWLLRQSPRPQNGRQGYPDFWYGVTSGLVHELGKDKTWLRSLKSPCV
ncbi:hypothetical protein PENSPDRAFT_648156 [Peniophora sp. CONT]|nr:hypothetical protein PENSPDRAFT_648156 [Peniophora sp. CONT]